MQLIHSNVISSGTTSGLISASSSCLIEVIGSEIPDTWYQFGSIAIKINDELIPNKLPVIFSTNLTNAGLLYIPNHNYNYIVTYFPKVWLLNLNPLPELIIHKIEATQFQLSFTI